MGGREREREKARARVYIYDGYHVQGLLQIALDLVRRRYLQTQQVSERTMSQNVREKPHQRGDEGLLGLSHQGWCAGVAELRGCSSARVLGVNVSVRAAGIIGFTCCPRTERNRRVQNNDVPDHALPLPLLPSRGASRRRRIFASSADICRL